METKEIKVNTAKLAANAANFAIAASIEFSVIPYPFGEYVFKVKPEAELALRKHLKHISKEGLGKYPK